MKLIDEKTIVIPGHGALAKKADLQRFYNMLIETSAEIEEGVESGLALPTLQEKGFSQDWKDWGSGFISQDRWIEILYTDLTTD